VGAPNFAFATALVQKRSCDRYTFK